MKATVKNNVIFINNNLTSSISELKKCSNVIVEKNNECGYDALIENELFHVENGKKSFSGFTSKVLFAY